MIHLNNLNISLAISKMLSTLPIQMLSAQQEEHSHQFQLLNSQPIRAVRRQNVFYKFKLVLLGESGVGKSALALRFAKDKFNEKFDSTIGAGFFLPSIWLEHGDGQSTKIKLEIWDTAGQVRRFWILFRRKKTN